MIYEKMTLEDLRSMFPKPSSHYIQHRDGKRTRRATKRFHRHSVSPVWLPIKPSVPPAEYRRRHLGKKK